MRIEHIALYVEDLERMRDFYISFFGAESNEGYHNEKTDFRSYFLKFQDGARLEIMNHPNMVKLEKDYRRNGYIHLAFSAGSKENVNHLTKRLADAGFKVISGPRTTGDGYYESCVLDPEDNQIEITE
ncbi:VOC family protein [Paenibacillus durus]|uniref:Glyoxalase n=1 Tax=Paenibacillus durus ATCC 35681 TaxID=1333534 RepID=A0A0F7FCY5_PAEDU|nr:VOC family protein [Paenibacillus durus]AKG36679.1 glyoxalase [Paenibacillus durus ATCC 35681]